MNDCFFNLYMSALYVLFYQDPGANTLEIKRQAWHCLTSDGKSDNQQQKNIHLLEFEQQKQASLLFY